MLSTLLGYLAITRRPECGGSASKHSYFLDASIFRVPLPGEEELDFNKDGIPDAVGTKGGSVGVPDAV